MNINPEQITDILHHVAETQIKPRYQTLGQKEISTKSGPWDLVTIADQEAEKALTVALREALPGSLVVGEESVSADKSVLKRLEESDKWVWIVDPIDGTSNFVKGEGKFGILLALCKGNTVHAAWMLDIKDDRLIYAIRGEGVWFVEDNGATPKNLSVNNTIDMNDMRGRIGWHYLRRMSENAQKVLKSRTSGVFGADVSIGEYMDLLLGDIHFLSIVLITPVNPWDHAAGAMIFEEAGGYVRKGDGSVYRPSDLIGGVFCAPNEDIWQALHPLIFGEMEEIRKQVDCSRNHVMASDS